jgi:hypothetical protein
MPMSDREWLATLKPGDAVRLRVDGTLHHVAKVTPKTVTLDDGTRWESRDGWRVDYICDPVDWKRSKVALAAHYHIKWSQVPEDIIDRLFELIEK